MSKKKSIIVTAIMTLLMAIIAIGCFASFEIPGTVKKYNSVMSLIGKGIDLEGGYYAVLNPSTTDGTDVDLEGAIEVLRARLDDNGYGEATLSIQDLTKIRVEIPEIDNVDDILGILTNTGELQFRDATGKVWLTGDDVESSYPGYDNTKGSYVVVLNFKKSGITKFYNATNAAFGNSSDKSISIYLGDTLVSQANVNEPINSKTAQIEGDFTYEEANSMAVVINNGKSNYQFEIEETRLISSRLGENALEKSLLAAGIGLLIIFVFMAIVYGGLGIAANLALVIYTLLYVILLAIIPNVQLTLPGIAGIILSLGMAVDANIIIFERIKDEYATGKTINAAIKSGFKRAVITVLDSNVTTIIAAIVLYFLSNGSIKSFAITLLLGTVVSMFTAVLITRWIIKLLQGLSSTPAKLFKLVREEGSENA